MLLTRMGSAWETKRVSLRRRQKEEEKCFAATSVSDPTSNHARANLIILLGREVEIGRRVHE